METLNRESLDKIINDHFRYEATDDLEGVLGTLADDAEHEIVGGAEGLQRGKAAIRNFYERLFSELKGEGVEPLSRLYGPDFLIDEAVWTGEVFNGRTFGLEGRSGRASFRLLHVFQLRDGLIAKESVWFDYNALRAQLK